MNPSIKLFFLVALLFSPVMAAEENLHNWGSISYPDIPTEFADGKARASISRGENGLSVSLGFSWSNEEAKKGSFQKPDGSKMTLRLHHSNGLIAEPRNPDLDQNTGMIFSRRHHSWSSFDWTFPWIKNEMREAWLQISISDHQYWLEIPYGFTRDPQTKKLPTSKSGPPKLPATLKPIPKTVTLVKWKAVYYDIGEIQNGWKASLRHSNPFDAAAELILYRDDSEVGKSSFLWDLHEPRTTLRIKQSDGHIVHGFARSLRLHDDGMRRSDTFTFNRNPGNDQLRDWGTMVIKVGDKEWTTIMPSSLFRYVHGAADPSHESIIR